MICPKCKEKLTLINSSYKCKNNHCYDISKEGYVNLLLSKTDAGDNKDLINARINFLNKDYYLPLVNKLSSIIKDLNTKVLLDAGCGTGYYTNYFKQVIDSVYGSDISKDAIKYASKKNKEITYFVSSNQFIPLENNSIDTIINIFAPYFENEFHRLLKQNGYLIIVHAGEKHLWELKELIYDTPYLNPITNFDFTKFGLVNEEILEYKKVIPSDDLNSLFMMTPYYYKTKNNDYSKINTVSSLNLTISFKITIFRRK